MKLPKIKINKKIKLIFFLSIFLLAFSYTLYLNKKSVYLEKNIAIMSEEKKVLESSLEEALYEDHINLSDQSNLISQMEVLEAEIEELNSVKENQEYKKISEIYKSYDLFSSKIGRNIKANLDVKEFEGKIDSWGEKILKKELDDVKSDIQIANQSLDEYHEKYLASLPKTSPQKASTSGSNYMTIDTEKGKFTVYLIKVSLSDVKVITASANGDDCKDNCPTKSLADHVKDNGGFAGINGAYFCPPDYSSCSGKVNSSDYAFYKSSSKKWLNKEALSWGDTGLATFNGSSPKFYKKSSDYGGGSVTAGISNYPALLSGGNVVIDSSKLTSYQKDVKGARGAIGVGDSNLYLAIISNATVIDAAYVMKALGAKDALNLDGGGSSALYLNGSYIVGPGRSLPNAVILVK
ncbi:phosphodiester glycosidase family protein [Patescibacteria group bacterium]|nr:phosphodiester glycosidase family protein [Patescibacteria group bacterium]